MRRAPTILSLWLTAATLLAQCGCTASVGQYVRNGFKVGPNYQPPPVPLSPSWVDQDDKRVQPGDPNLAAWWEVFDDPILTELIHRSYAGNLTVRAAAFQILAAQEQRAIALGQLFPQNQAAALQYLRSQVSQNLGSGGAAGGGGGVVGGSSFFSNWATSVNLAWEIDFWGKFRRNLEAADASLDQSVFNYDEVVVLLLANVATQYVEIRTLQKRIDLAKKNVAFLEPLVEKLAQIQKAGAAQLPDYLQLKASLDSSKGLIPQLELTQRQANNQLCILLGIPVRDLLPELGDGTVPDAAKPGQRTVYIPRPKTEEVVMDIPASLLWRRPDVRAAERQLQVQSAQIGIAEAEMYPHISIIASKGMSAADLNRLFLPASGTGTIGPSLTWNVLNYGRLLANVRLQNHVYQQQVANYQNIILNANAEAENAMVGYLKSREQYRNLQNATDAARESARYIGDQAKQGFLGKGQTTSSQSSQLFNVNNFQVTQQDAAAQAEGNIALNLILLYRAMGGGWQIRYAAANMPGLIRPHFGRPIVQPSME